MSYGHYAEQLTSLLFLKMTGEREQPPWMNKHWIYDLRTNKHFTSKAPRPALFSG